MAKLYDVATGQAVQVAAHDEPVRVVRFFTPTNGQEMLATASWDKKIKYWDMRSPAPAGTLELPDRVYTMDVQQGLLVAGTANRHIAIVNLAQPGTIFKSMQSPLKWQTRVISCFPNATGFAVGSIEGRVAIQHVDEKNASYVDPI